MYPEPPHSYHLTELMVYQINTRSCRVLEKTYVPFDCETFSIVKLRCHTRFHLEISMNPFRKRPISIEAVRSFVFPFISSSLWLCVPSMCASVSFWLVPLFWLVNFFYHTCLLCIMYNNGNFCYLNVTIVMFFFYSFMTCNRP